MKREIRSLTGLRGIAAVVVMAYHIALVPGHGAIVSHGPGYLMVDLFFVLSGFVMALTYGRRFAPGLAGWAAYRQFLQARFARLYPLYGLIVVGVFVLTKLHATTSASFPVRAFASNIVMLQNLGAGWIAPGFAEYLDPPSWSISTELAAYLLFPALAALALFGSVRIAAALLTLCAAVLLALSVVPRPWIGQPPYAGALDISSGETLWPLLRCLAGFCIGLVTYRVSGPLASWRRTFALDAALVVSLAALWLWNGSDFAIVCLFPLLILQVCTDSSPLAGMLGSALPYRLGLWSYAIYLLHWPAIDLLRLIQPMLRQHVPHPDAVAPMLLAVLVVGVSAALYEGYEKPARTLLKHGFRRALRKWGVGPPAPAGRGQSPRLEL